MNTTDSAVRIIHKPTGIKVECQEERSQLQNREKAMRYLRARLLQKAQDEAQAKEAAARRSQLGTGDRSEKIRTYNFPDGRVTDHRIKHTSHQLQDVLAGGEELDGFVDRLNAAERAQQLAEGDDEVALMRPAEVVRRAAGYLDRHGVESPAADRGAAARQRPRHRSGRPLRTRRVPSRRPRPERSAGPSAAGARGRPLQHLTGEQGFRRLVLSVRPGVFIPRPETEVLVDVALAAISRIPSAGRRRRRHRHGRRSPCRSPTSTRARGSGRRICRPMPWRSPRANARPARA